MVTGTPRPHIRKWVLAGCALALATCFLGGTASVRGGKVDVLRVGTSISLTGDTKGKKEGSARETLKSFIKEETGLDNEGVSQKDWRELAENMAKGQLHLGVFEGYEFAWAQEKYPDLQPLAVAVNVYKYPIGYVIVQRTNNAKDFAGLQGQSLAIPTSGPHFLKLFVEHECEANKKSTATFFSKVTTPESIEDALDDVVDGVVQATVVDRAALEAFKRKKPGRFKQIKEVAHSQPFPPPLIAYYGKVLDEPTRTRFKDGLLGASKKEKGQTMLTLFHLTAFEPVPDDFGKVLADTRKTYPPPGP
jgi:ABC-type phosphate/phosphonate transport system substrate-binding protein